MSSTQLEEMLAIVIDVTNPKMTQDRPPGNDIHSNSSIEVPKQSKQLVERRWTEGYFTQQSRLHALDDGRLDNHTRKWCSSSRAPNHYPTAKSHL